MIPDTFLQFTTGFDDVTVTVTWAPVSGDAQAAKDAAITRLNTVKNGLTGDGVQAAYDAGVKAIQTASTAAEVDKAYQAAVVAMRKAADYGKVQVIVENTTFTSDLWPDGKEYWDGELVNEWIDLNADSTMMNCIVAALEKHGFTQTGAENGYISSIEGLSQMDGGDQSGWMGTLNDWFTNFGFKEFTVENGSLSNGDVIRIMYSREGLGADVGGTWGNSDTTLAALDIQGGKLLTRFVPGEAGNTYEYTLAIDGESADLKLTPTAANKNYLTKIFLNEKVTSDEEGGSFFKRTQMIPVAGGRHHLCGLRRIRMAQHEQAGVGGPRLYRYMVCTARCQRQRGRVLCGRADRRAARCFRCELRQLPAVRRCRRCGPQGV